MEIVCQRSGRTVERLSQLQTNRIPGYIVIRTKYIDDAILAITGSPLPAQFSTLAVSKPQILQVIEVGSGFDSRPWRLEFVEGLQWYEVDHHAIVESKKRILGKHKAALTAKVMCFKSLI